MQENEIQAPDSSWKCCVLSPDFRVRDHEVQVVFTATTRPSGTPAVAWLPPPKSQTAKATVQKPLMGLELHVAIVKFHNPAEFPIFAL